MSAYRDSLTPRQRVVYDEAVDRVAQIYVDACARRDSLTPEAAADEAYVPGGPSREEIAEKIRRMRADARARSAA